MATRRVLIDITKCYSNIADYFCFILSEGSSVNTLQFYKTERIISRSD